MQIYFSVKQLSKRLPYIKQMPIEIAGQYGEPCLLKDFLERVVRQQVNAYNQKREEKTLFSFLQETEISQAAEAGKVSFGEIYNRDKADETKALETVRLAFIDGLIAVFIDDTQVENLEQEITLQENTVVTFVRLTFLAGSTY